MLTSYTRPEGNIKAITAIPNPLLAPIVSAVIATAPKTRPQLQIARSARSRMRSSLCQEKNFVWSRLFSYLSAVHLRRRHSGKAIVLRRRRCSRKLTYLVILRMIFFIFSVRVLGVYARRISFTSSKSISWSTICVVPDGKLGCTVRGGMSTM